jgi:hypothetical protein
LDNDLTCIHGLLWAMNILLIEDEPKIADFVMEGFHALGWHSTHALDGAAGLDALGRVRFDAIVLDWMLPTMDGMVFWRVCANKAMTPQSSCSPPKPNSRTSSRVFKWALMITCPSPFIWRS